jgi:hypothetical protein
VPPARKRLRFRQQRRLTAAGDFDVLQPVGRVVDLRADCQWALRRRPAAAQDFILPHLQMA